MRKLNLTTLVLGMTWKGLLTSAWESEMILFHSMSEILHTANACEEHGGKYLSRYLDGGEEPNFALPTTLDNADTACNWMNLSFCLMGKNPCLVCIERWEDQLIHDNPELD